MAQPHLPSVLVSRIDQVEGGAQLRRVFQQNHKQAYGIYAIIPFQASEMFADATDATLMAECPLRLASGHAPSDRASWQRLSM